MTICVSNDIHVKYVNIATNQMKLFDTLVFNIVSPHTLSPQRAQVKRFTRSHDDVDETDHTVHLGCYCHCQ